MYLGCIISFFVVLYILMIYIVSNLCEPIIPQIKIPKMRRAAHDFVRVRLHDKHTTPFADKIDDNVEKNDIELKNAVDKAFDLVF